MKFRRALDGILRGAGHVGALRIMLRFPAKEFTGREIARLARISPPRMNRVLESLRAEGIVHRREAGRSHLWRLNRRHYAVGSLDALYRFEGGVLDSLRSRIRSALQGVPVRRAVVFGSTARGEERPDSDVDLLIEIARERDRRRVEDRIPRLEEELIRAFGNPLAALIYTTADLRRERNRALAARIREEGLLILGSREAGA